MKSHFAKCNLFKQRAVANLVVSMPRAHFRNWASIETLRGCPYSAGSLRVPPQISAVLYRPQPELSKYIDFQKF